MTTQTLSRVSFPSIRLRIGTWWPLLSILSLESILALSLRNTAFQDEALYLYAGRQFLHALLGGPPVTEPYGQYFAGLPYIHPLIAGILDTIGGIELARLFSLLCMLVATVMVYRIAQTLFDRYSALLAASLFAVQGSVLLLARLATFDAMCVALLALTTWLALQANARQGRWYGVLVGLALGAASVTKFAALLFAPTIFALLIWRSFTAWGWRTAFWRVFTCGIVLIIVFAVPYLLDPNVRIGLTQTTTARIAIFSLPRVDIVLKAVGWCGVLVALAVVGVIVNGKNQRLLVAILFLGSTLLAPAYHTYKMEVVSLQKHVVFSMFFAAPLAGFAVSWLSQWLSDKQAARRWLISLTACLLVFSLGFSQAQGLYNEWPSSTALTQLLLTQVRPTGRLLAEESEVPRYYLQNVVNFWQWNQLYWFYYTDKQGRHLTGVAAYRAAIADGYFDLVILRYGPNLDVAHQIDSGLLHGTQYELISKLPFSTSFGTGAYWVWRRINGVSHVFF